MTTNTVTHTTVVDVLKEIGISLTPDQISAVNTRLQVKRTRPGNKYVRTEIPIGPRMSLPNQCRVILDALTPDYGPVTVQEWSELVTGKLTTTQPVERVVGYYTKQLVNMGLIDVA